MLHIPVMLNEISEHLLPVLQSHPSPRYLDGTLGRGGHLRHFLNSVPQLKAIAFDQDPEAIAYAQAEFSKEIAQGRLQLVHSNFASYQAEVHGEFDAGLVDLGVSSPQLDQGRRGFSFIHDGPLDMRMNSQAGETAAEVINTYSEEDLNTIFKKYGELFKPYRVTRAVVHDRREKPFESTLQLAGLIERVDGWRKKGFHPATQYFMALRLYVNQELQSVEQGIPQILHGLKSKGRLSVLTFHSLEDRIVKYLFRDSSLGVPVNKKVIVPSEEEEQSNPRSRSAKLRTFERDGE
ncbi:MAG: 16S rRNA (cytosine(1402)-N(4))-methyltransferase RsmH [Pseudobdellovibrionaceae bacterium]|jgi:16S rRNA (cytosine1402-N4)-methyltransferase